MPDTGININPDSGGTAYIPLPNQDSKAVQSPVQDKATSQAKQADAVNGKYYTDSTSSAATQERTLTPEQSKNLLTHIAPPNVQMSGISGTAAQEGTGNPFLRPNPLVAFFMTFTEISNTMRQMTNAYAQLTILQMTMTNELGKGIAAEILRGAQAEHDSYMAAAIADFTQAGVALIQGAAQFKAKSSAQKQLNQQRESMEKRTYGEKDASGEKIINPGTEQKLADAKIGKTNAEQAVKNAEHNLRNAEKNYANDKSTDSRKAVREAQKELDTQERKLYDTSRKLDEAEYQHDKNVKGLDKFEEDYAGTLEGATQNKMYSIKMSGDFVSKAIEGISNMMRAGYALEKGQAEAMQKLMEGYQQNANKTIDLLNNMKSENSRLIGDLMQQLRGFSDQARQLYGTIGVQGG
ncbi:MAG: hypothetical protein BGO14_09875 [Chlamydiales bacterium 38-26]|nr:hypothetical protein [Chlamydiales bacterium]OJV11277.1 MAG: hypothetical protein BGO14_09875 [Chlamydiales bacterium 38-26]